MQGRSKGSANFASVYVSDAGEGGSESLPDRVQISQDGPVQTFPLELGSWGKVCTGLLLFSIEGSVE